MSKIVVENFLRVDENRYYFETEEAANQKATQFLKISRISYWRRTTIEK